MNQHLSPNQLEELAALSFRPLELPSSSSTLASERTLCLFAAIQGDQTYQNRLRRFCEALLQELKKCCADQALAVNRHLNEHLQSLMTIVHSLAHVASYPTKYEVVGISLNKNDYVKGRQFGTLSYGPMDRIIGMLTADNGRVAFCRLRKGTLNRKTGEGLRSRLEPLLHVKDRLVQAGLVWSRHPHKIEHSSEHFPLVVRYYDSGPLIPLDRPFSDLEGVLPLVNARLSKARIELNFPDYASYRRLWDFNTGRFKIAMQGNQLRRTFKYDEQSGGRLYGHHVQSLPSELRRHLTINGSPVVEYDYTAMLVHLAYDELGFTCDLPDPYVLPGFDEKDRDVFKEIFKRVIGTDTDEQMNIGHAVREGKGRYLHAHETALYEEAFWRTHEPLKALANTSAWRPLQLRESEIALTILSAMERQGIVCIPIHDGMIVQQQNEGALKEAMADAVLALSSRPAARKVC